MSFSFETRFSQIREEKKRRNSTWVNDSLCVKTGDYKVEAKAGASDDFVNMELTLDDYDCAICKTLMSNPVMNIYKQTYCFECITNYYNNLYQKYKDPKDNNEADCQAFIIRDPLTNQIIPKQFHSLLVPNIKIQFEIINVVLNDEIKSKHMTLDEKNEYTKYENYYISKYHNVIIENLDKLNEFNEEYYCQSVKQDHLHHLTQLSESSMQKIFDQLTENFNNNDASKMGISFGNVSKTIVDSIKYPQRILYAAKSAMAEWNDPDRPFNLCNLLKWDEFGIMEFESNNNYPSLKDINVISYDLQEYIKSMSNEYVYSLIKSTFGQLNSVIKQEFDKYISLNAMLDDKTANELCEKIELLLNDPTFHSKTIENVALSMEYEEKKEKFELDNNGQIVETTELKQDENSDIIVNDNKKVNNSINFDNNNNKSVKRELFEAIEYRNRIDFSRKFAKCVKNRRNCRVYAMDTTGELTCDHLREMLDACGVDTTKSEMLIEECKDQIGKQFINHVKGISKWLKQHKSNNNNNNNNNKAPFYYWAHLKDIQAVKTLDEKDLDFVIEKNIEMKMNNDEKETKSKMLKHDYKHNRMWFKIKLDLDYKKHLKKYDNNSFKLAKIIRNQLGKHLRIKIDKNYSNVTIDKILSHSDASDGCIAVFVAAAIGTAALIDGCGIKWVTNGFQIHGGASGYLKNLIFHGLLPGAVVGATCMSLAIACGCTITLAKSGVGIGAWLGGCLGGPLGLVAGATVGAVLGAVTGAIIVSAVWCWKRWNKKEAEADNGNSIDSGRQVSSEKVAIAIAESNESIMEEEYRRQLAQQPQYAARQNRQGQGRHGRQQGRHDHNDAARARAALKPKPKAIPIPKPNNAISNRNKNENDKYTNKYNLFNRLKEKKGKNKKRDKRENKNDNNKNNNNINNKNDDNGNDILISPNINLVGGIRSRDRYESDEINHETDNDSMTVNLNNSALNNSAYKYRDEGQPFTLSLFGDNSMHRNLPSNPNDAQMISNSIHESVANKILVAGAQIEFDNGDNQNVMEPGDWQQGDCDWEY